MPNYIRIEALRMLRNKRYIVFVVAFPVIFYLLFCNVLGGETAPGGIGASAYLMVSMSAYGSLAASIMSTAVPWAQERQSGWLRQLQITPLPNRTIILTKLAAALLLTLPSLLLVFLAAVLTQDVSLEPGQWIGLVPAMWIGTLPFAALGLAVGSLVPPDTAQPAAMIGMFGLAILGGLWFPVDNMPTTMQAIAHALPSFPYADIGWHLVAGETPPLQDVVTILAWTVALGAAAVLAYRRATARA
ncbi:ABC transporter [Streptosporangium carneum]|uniref:ABC transporter n=2 Tax=Streptosporangium carneum TaxID=47481 RepID=A0A9W6I208_9ACTN|nr:ABC transporter [Streptosporangium carneum]